MGSKKELVRNNAVVSNQYFTNKPLGMDRKETIVAVKDIVGIHPKIQHVAKLYGDLSLTVKSPVNKEGESRQGVFRFEEHVVLSIEAISYLLTNYPIHVQRCRNRLYCVGDLRLWKLVRDSLDPNQKIKIFELPPRTSQQSLESLMFTDVLIAPVIFGKSVMRPATIGARLEAILQIRPKWLKETLVGISGKRAFARLLGKSRNCVFRIGRANEHKEKILIPHK